MILNHTIDGIVRGRLQTLYRVIPRFSVLLLLSACGGGLGGSGDGGDGTSSIVTLPDAFEPAYQFRHVPERLIARFPSSLANDKTTVALADASPYSRLTSTVSQLIDSKLEIGLLQLLLEANWTKIIAHCEATSGDSACDLTGAGISTAYTAAMASWEFLLRAGIVVERSGDTDALTEEIQADIIQQVNARIGTALSLENGLFTKNSSGSYRYEISLLTDLGFGQTAYTTRWSENRDLTFISVAEIDTNLVDNLQSSTNSRDASTGFSNAILMTTFANGARQERQLNLNRPNGSSPLRVEANLTEITDSSKSNYYSIGHANSSGGFLSSEHSSEDNADLTISDFIRESFTEDATIESQSICRMSSSMTQCDQEDRWAVTTSSDPVLSQFFLSTAQLRDVEDRLMPFNLDIQGVSLELDTLLLIRRENLAITFSAAGVVITLPGLGTFNLGNDTVTAEPDVETDDSEEPFSDYADSVLCRINTAVLDDQIQYRSFCAGTIEEIESALVIGESFREGKLVFEWQANAIVDVIENKEAVRE